MTPRIGQAQISRRSRRFSCSFEAVSRMSAYDCGEACTSWSATVQDCGAAISYVSGTGLVAKLPRRKALKWGRRNGQRLETPFSHLLPNQYRLSFFYDGISIEDSSPTKRMSRFLVAMLHVLPGRGSHTHPQRLDTTGSRRETRGRHIGRERACTSLDIFFGQSD